MKEFTLKTKIESNTDYIATKKEYHIYPEDTIRSYEGRYMATSTLAGPFLDIAFLIKNVKNTTIDFGGAKLIFHGRIAPFVLDGCENFTIKNCSMDYDRPFYTTADILECDTSHMKLHIDKGYPYRIEGNRMFMTSDTWENGLNVGDMLFKIMSSKTCQPIEGLPIILALIGEEIFTVDRPPMPITQLLAEEDGENVILHGVFPKEWEGIAVGNKVAMTHEKRDKNSITALGCKDLLVENVRIINGASLAFTGIRNDGVTLRHFDFYRDEENPGYIMNNADAIHTFHSKGYFNIEDCRIEALLDDQINVHNQYLRVSEVGEDYIITYIPGVGTKVELDLFAEGDEIAVFDDEFTEHTRLTAKEVIRTEKGYIIYTDADLSKVKKGELVETISGNCDLTVKNCVFANTYGQIRLQTRGKILFDNCIFDKDFQALLLSGDALYWYEGAPVRDLTVQNCEFLREPCVPLSVSPGVAGKEPYHQNIRLINNKVASSILLRAEGAGQITSYGNVNIHGKKMIAQLRNCVDCDIQDAEVCEGNEISGL